MFFHKIQKHERETEGRVGPKDSALTEVLSGLLTVVGLFPNATLFLGSQKPGSFPTASFSLPWASRSKLEISMEGRHKSTRSAVFQE